MNSFSSCRDSHSFSALDPLRGSSRNEQIPTLTSADRHHQTFETWLATMNHLNLNMIPGLNIDVTLTSMVVPRGLFVTALQ